MSAKLRARLRRAVFVIHLWIGLSVGLLFAVVSATGSAIVFRRELDGMARPELARVVAPRGTAPLELGAVRDRLRADHPEARAGDGSLFVFQPWDGAALSTFVAGRSLAVDPYSGRTLAVLTSFPTLPGWAKDLHTDLLAGEGGKGLNGWGGLLASLLLLSGLWLWWPATRRQLRLRLTVRRRVSLRRTSHDLHNVMGFYSLAALFVVTVTGVGLCFNKPVGRFVNAHTPHNARLRPEPVAEGSATLSIEALMAIARKEVPGSRFVTVTLPTGPRRPFAAMMQRTGAGFFPYVSLRLDPHNGRVIGRDDDATDPLGKKIMRQIAVLHFGIWGGLPSKILYVVLGLIPLGLYVTGVMLWWNRLCSQRRAIRRAGGRDGAIE